MKTIALALILWTFGFSGIAQNISITFTGTGAATTIDSVTATNLRTNERIIVPGKETLVLTVNSGIPAEQELLNSGMVYPNPFAGKTTILITVQKPQLVDLKIQNLAGQAVAQISTLIQPGDNQFDLSLAVAGVYLVSIACDQGTNGYKILCIEANKSGNRIQYNGTISGQENNSASPGLKSSLNGYSLGYVTGDVILYRCRSGIHTTIVTDSPVSSKNYEVEFTACTDPDGKNYSSVKIGSQTWMAENLAWLPAVSPSNNYRYEYPVYCVYGYQNNIVSIAKSKTNFSIYGALYNWEAARIVCPSGWHLPSDEEWKILEKDLGMSQSDADTNLFRNTGQVGGKLKETGTAHWLSTNTGSNNFSGFTALPGGSSQGYFYNLGAAAHFWSSSETISSFAWARGIFDFSDGIGRYDSYAADAYSVRCIRNEGYFATVITAEIGSITDTSAFSGGNISFDGRLPVTTRGVCWNTDGTPTISDSKTTDGIGTGVFTSTLSGLTPGTRYHVRAYATNSAVTAYGEENHFYTTGSGGDTYTDTRDGHVYKKITIGKQTWMAENFAYLPIVNVSSNLFGGPPSCFVYGYLGTNINDAKASSNFSIYGVLYNWSAAISLCPEGWHLPTDEEWKILEMNQGMSQAEANVEGYSRGSGAVPYKIKECGTSHWNTTDRRITNSSGFTALPGGKMDGGFFYLGETAHFWSSSENDSYGAWSRGLSGGLDVNVNRYPQNKGVGFSVRCMRDVAAISTMDATEISETFASSGGNIADDGGEPVIARGVCWSTSQNPTVFDNITFNGAGKGSFTSHLSGLINSTTYHVRAYARSMVGISYGQQVTFITSGVEYKTFTDSRDNTVYRYKTIGTQTWMIDNLAYLSSVSRSTVGSSSSPLCYVYGFEGSDTTQAKATDNYSIYGALYNWRAALSACPSGWRLPSDQEWTTLTVYLGGEYLAGGKMKEKGTTHWLNTTASTNNSSGFSAIPGGTCYAGGGGFYGIGSNTTFWSLTEGGPSTSWTIKIDSEFDQVRRLNHLREPGFSVRCIKD